MKLLAVFIFAALCISAMGESFTIPALTASPATPIELKPVVGGSATLKLNSNVTDGSINVCVQRGIKPPAKVAWAGCTQHILVPRGQTAFQTTFNFYAGGEATLFISAYTNNTISVNLDGEFTVDAACPSDEVWVNNNCTTPVVLSAGVTSGLLSVSKGANKFYFAADLAETEYPSAHTLKIASSGLAKVAVSGFFSINKMDATPTWVVNVTNVETTSIVKLPSVIPGQWYFSVSLESSVDGEMNATLLSAGTCDGGASPLCASTVNKVTSGNSFSANASSIFTYVAYNGTATPDWKIGVSTVNGYNSGLKVYVAKGYLPFRTVSGDVIADWSGGCTLPASSCASVVSIVLPKASPAGAYFTAVSYHNNTAPVSPFVLWANTDCPLCDHGTCNKEAGANYGKCACYNGWTGVNCKTSAGGFKIQIIVVIIIGGLLLLTALIGLIAWFVSRKKQNGYSSL